MYEQEKWELRAETARKLGLASADDVALAVAKPLARPTARVSGRRRQRLRARLAELEDQMEPIAEAPQADAPSALLQAACGACRGHCCRDGGEHAYLKPEDLARARAALGGQPEDMVELYLGFVPRRSYQGSCIFHSAKGCALPRALRSSVCRNFLCSPLAALQARTRNHPAKAALVLFQDLGVKRRVCVRLP